MMRKIMNWVLVATLVCGASVLTSCSSDDIPVNPIIPAKDLLYQWVVEYDMEDIEGDGVTVDHAVKVYEFFADGTGYYEYYMLNKGELEFVEYLRGFNGEFTYTVSNNLVTIKLLDEFDEQEPIWNLTFTDGHLIDPDDRVFRHSTDAEHEQILEWYTMWTNIPTPPDINVAEKIIGKWMVAETNGKPVVTNSKQVLTYVSDTKLYYSLSITAISDLNVWVNHCEGSYIINGTTLEQLVELPDDNIKFSHHINVTSITDDEMLTVTNNETFVNGQTHKITKDLMERKVRVTRDYSDDIIGTWEGKLTSEQDTYSDGQVHRWEYKADGTYPYYRQNEGGEWIADVNTMAEYFVDGTLLCSRWKNVGDDTEKRESWEIASIENGKMKWTALRQNADGSTYTTTFEMTRVNP